MFNIITQNFNITYDKYLEYLLLKNFINSCNLIFNKNEDINIINKNFNFMKYILFILKKNRFIINLFELKKILKKFKVISKKNNYKILSFYKKKFFNNKKLALHEKIHLKNKIFIKKKNF
jgi:hypothetical protein